jgi:sulfate adenylyltransferase large subunit
MNAPVRSPSADQAQKLATSAFPAAAERSLLRFLTCGSVDDGKSTLIGRLLFEAGAVPDDLLITLDKDSERHGTTGGRDFALLVDGLAAEREQGITIDVAYRYFSTPKRSFIVADTPGHEQYTRNMATGASTADLAVILIDARKGVLPQTRRHAYIASMLGIRHVVLAVNKMDLVEFSEDRFRSIERDALAIIAPLGFHEAVAIPIASRDGVNIATASPSTPWYKGLALLTHLEQVEIGSRQSGPFRFPVQWVNRPNADFRGFSGSVASGFVRPGDAIKVLPSGQNALVQSIFSPDGETLEAGIGEVPTLVLDREIDVSRGDVIVAANDGLQASRRFAARLLWMGAQWLDPSAPLRLKLASTEANVTAIDLSHLIDIHSYEAVAAAPLGMNALAGVRITLDRAITAIDHDQDRVLGSFILIDPVSGATVGLGVVDSKAYRAEAAHTEAKSGWLRRIFYSSNETHLRSFAKAFTWRAAGSLATFLLSWVFTQDVRIAAAIGATEVVSKFALYYVHERAWALISFGLKKPPSPNENKDGGGI